MIEEKNGKNKQLPLPKNYTEFYPKNYSKKDQIIKIKHPLEKDSASFYPKSLTKKTPPKNPDNNDDSSEDDYSGLACKNSENKKFQSYKPKKYHRNSEDYNSYNHNNDYKSKWKTEMCHYWEMYGTCKFGNACAFAHGAEELNKRKMSLNYKTKPCKQFFELGYCTYGIRCQFSHKIKEEKEIDKENQISYVKILKEFNDQNNLISHEIIKRPRLNTFEDITKSGKEIKEKNRLALYEDILELKKKENEEPEKVFLEDTDDDNSIINNDINNLLNEDEENFEFNIDDYIYNGKEDNNDKNNKEEDGKNIND